MAARPVTAWLDDVLSGRIGMDDAPPAIQSWARFSIHQGAMEIVLMEWKGDRTAALERIPPTVRPYVESEVRRLWPMRHVL